MCNDCMSLLTLYFQVCFVSFCFVFAGLQFHDRYLGMILLSNLHKIY